MKFSRNQLFFVPIVLCLMLFSLNISAQRKVINIDSDWWFRLSSQVNKDVGQRVDLPHTWNNIDALSGDMNYERGVGNYTKKFKVPENWKGKRLFLRFKGANTVSDIFVNGKFLGEHRGGYEAFIFELTNKVEYGKENTILVRVDNSLHLDVMPLVGDFNFYGGIYRDVSLILTNAICISPLDYASSGVYLRETKVNEHLAEVNADVALSNSMDYDTMAIVRVKVMKGGKVICNKEKSIRIKAKAIAQMTGIPLEIHQPHLWDGTSDPFMYDVDITLINNGQVIDGIRQHLGLRYYRVDPDKGFFLNGRSYRLHGVSRHQDRAEVGNALRPFHHEEDARLMHEMGVNAVRLSHYPQASYFYDLMDKYGIVVWSEIPFVGPGGYADKGYVNMPSFRENGKQQLIELIRQNYNHPSICFWGLFNELNYNGDNPVEYVRELNALAHKEDSTRLTTCASNQPQGDLNSITDVMAWNRYDGWYSSNPATLAKFLDYAHAKYPTRCIGISEYGAGASIYQQQDTLRQPDPTGWWHPENWQTYYHIQNWRIISQRPYIWASFVWNMFDFGAAHRREGDRPGINDKGLVTFDRKTKKDAFYFYKSNWNPEPMVYIAGKRDNLRTHRVTTIQVFSNCSFVTLFVNGKIVSKVKPDDVHVCTFKVSLREGENEIKAEAKDGFHKLSDSCQLTLNQ